MKMLLKFEQRMCYFENSIYGAGLRLYIARLKVQRELQKEIDKLYIFLFRKLNKLMILIAKN